jgi:hypothetical protein
MMNALEELKEVLKENNKTIDNIIAIRVVLEVQENDDIAIYTLEDLKDVNYDDGYGSQNLYGIILLDDNDWLERLEYDGAEWWEYRRNPHLVDDLVDLEKWLNKIQIKLN